MERARFGEQATYAIGDLVQVRRHPVKPGRVIARSAGSDERPERYSILFVGEIVAGVIAAEMKPWSVECP